MTQNTSTTRTLGNSIANTIITALVGFVLIVKSLSWGGNDTGMTRKEKAALRRRYQTLKDYDSQFKEVPRPVSTDILALFSQIEGPVADRPEFIALTDSGEVKHINTHKRGSDYDDKLLRAAAAIPQRNCVACGSERSTFSHDGVTGRRVGRIELTCSGCETVF